MNDLTVIQNFFYGFGASAVLPFSVGVFVGIKNALRASVLDD